MTKLANQDIHNSNPNHCRLSEVRNLKVFIGKTSSHSREFSEHLHINLLDKNASQVLLSAKNIKHTSHSPLLRLEVHSPRKQYQQTCDFASKIDDLKAIQTKFRLCMTRIITLGASNLTC